jgi:hypothetical protein
MGDEAKGNGGLKAGTPLNPSNAPAATQSTPTPMLKDSSGRYLPSKDGPRSRSGKYRARVKAEARPSAAGLIGVPGNIGPDAGRARRALNLATIAAMQDAFNRGGQKAIDEVMRDHPAIFLKMLVLLVPRELEIQHTGGVKGMSDEALEAAIEALERMLNAKTIDAQAVEAPTTS